MKSSATPRSNNKMKSSATPRSNRTSRRNNGNGNSQKTPLRQQFEHMMSIPENGITDSLNGTQTPTPHRNRRNKTPSGRSSSNSNRRVATPSTSNKSRSKSDRADMERSADKSSTRTTNENDAPSNIRNSRSNSYGDSSSKTPKTKTSSSAKADRRIVLSPEVVVSPTKKLLNKVANLGSAKKKQNAMNDQTGWENEAVLELRLNKGVTRDLQNRAEGDPNRGNLGPGKLIVLKCTHRSVKKLSVHYMCQFIGDNGKQFLAKIPESSDAHNHMSLNTVENSFVWDAYESLGKQTRLRTFYFFFDDGFDMFAVLLHFFGGQNIGIVKEFLKGEAGRFKASTKLPPHSIVKNEDDMDVNSDDEEHRPRPLNKEEEMEMYGEVNTQSHVVRRA